MERAVTYFAFKFVALHLLMYSHYLELTFVTENAPDELQLAS
jgi:hypothetical protein